MGQKCKGNKKYQKFWVYMILSANMFVSYFKMEKCKKNVPSMWLIVAVRRDDIIVFHSKKCVENQF